MGRTRSSKGGIDRKELLWIVTELCRTARKNSTIPALRNILVESLAGGVLTLRATDLDLHISYVTDWRLSNEFRVLVNADKLKTLLGSDGNAVSLSHVSGEGGFGKLAVKVGGVIVRLPSLDPDGFSVEPEVVKEKVIVRFRGDEIVDALGFVVLAMSKDETRFNLCGVHLDGKRGRMESTDGHRSHMVSVGEEIVESADVVVRDLAVSALCRILKKKPGPVSIFQFGDADDPSILIVTGGWIMVSKAAMGKFPSVDQADVKDSKLDVVMVGDGKKLTKALKQVNKLARENVVRLDLCGDGVTALAGDPAEGDLVEMDLPLSAEKWDDPLNVTAKYNVRYLLEAVQHADGDVRIGLSRAYECPVCKGVKGVNTCSTCYDFGFVDVSDAGENPVMMPVATNGPLVVTPRRGWRVLIMPLRW